MKITSSFSGILLAFLWGTASANDTVLRYKQPIPPDVQVVGTKPEFGEVQDANPGVLLFPENGGYYLKHPDSNIVVAVSSDDLSTELDQSYMSLSRKLEGEGNHEEAVDVVRVLQENGADLQKREDDTDCGSACGGSYRCSHPRCVYPHIPGKCVHYSGCYICSSNRVCI
ncbi:uncharacterized protein N7498_010679 [Penicillium cinerascens]|uniref:Uncharacterized protein n=1 Tax=Penicillium cinerascens TaxID=70096 RepID=A0A9W9M7K4_9EURO|nr:uncharacterized protein N7498_010679 [Penicillium cinerascens]KAJ5191694.1 hypothetical protein N7498_010679 [Penicillium cinerascens]